jgi:hypothetical protein
MMKRKSRVKLAPRDIMRGKQYPGVRGKVADWVDQAFEDNVLYLHVRFSDKTELCWRIGTSLVIEEADLSDWKTGNFKQLAIFAERELDPAGGQQSSRRNRSPDEKSGMKTRGGKKAALAVPKDAQSFRFRPTPSS